MHSELNVKKKFKSLLPYKVTDHGFVGTSVTSWSLHMSTMVVLLMVGHYKVHR
jgi:hypothetical protein